MREEDALARRLLGGGAMRLYVVFFACAVAPLAGGGCFGFGGSTDSPSRSEAPYDPCASGAVIDLDASGVRREDGVQFVGSNAGVGSLAPIDSSCGRPNGHQVVLRYTPRRTGRLHLTTNVASTSFDTVVWVQDRCVATGARDLGCNDDGLEAPRTTATTMITTAAVSAGVPVFIVVAGFRGGRTPAVGSFGIVVTELAPDGAEGGACRASDTPCDGALLCPRGVCRAPAPIGGACSAQSPCVAGASCSTSTGGVCVADGTNGGRCRPRDPMPCDPGLLCGARLLDQPACAPPIPVGGACSLSATTCVAGSSCAILLPMPRCVTDGALGGRCVEGRGCDAGLTCAGESYCASVVATGAACDPSDGTRPCAAGAECRATAMGNRCVARTP